MKELRNLWCLACYGTVLRWPFSCFNRVAWPVYLWLLPWAGEHAFREDQTNDGSPELRQAAETFLDAMAGRVDYPDPTPEMLAGDPLFGAIWNAIKGWDISRHNNGVYSGPTGNDARHIYDAVRALKAREKGK